LSLLRILILIFHLSRTSYPRPSADQDAQGGRSPQPVASAVGAVGRLCSGTEAAQSRRQIGGTTRPTRRHPGLAVLPADGTGPLPGPPLNRFWQEVREPSQGSSRTRFGQSLGRANCHFLLLWAASSTSSSSQDSANAFSFATKASSSFLASGSTL